MVKWCNHNGWLHISRTFGHSHCLKSLLSFDGLEGEVFKKCKMRPNHYFRFRRLTVVLYFNVTLFHKTFCFGKILLNVVKSMTSPCCIKSALFCTLSFSYLAKGIKGSYLIDYYFVTTDAIFSWYWTFLYYDVHDLDLFILWNVFNVKGAVVFVFVKWNCRRFMVCVNDRQTKKYEK